MLLPNQESSKKLTLEKEPIPISIKNKNHSSKYDRKCIFSFVKKIYLYKWTFLNLT